jgi:hypothetical protein
MAAEGSVTAAGSVPADVPYRPSWIDQLIRAIERLPGPPWAFYLVAVAVLALAINVISWTSGIPEAPGSSVPKYKPWTFDLAQSGFAVYPVYIIAMMHYLNRVAAEKLAAFRLALDVDQRHYERLRYELTTLPARETALATLLGLGFVAILFGATWIFEGPLQGSTAFQVAALALSGVTIAPVAVLIYHTIHQLRLVSRIHALAPRIDLFQSPPLYAFSLLTARTGLGWAALLVFSWVTDPRIEPIGVALTVLILAVACAAFVLPLDGMHRRIAAEKERLQLEADRRLKASIAQLHQSVDELDLSHADPLNKTIDSLQVEREAIAKMSTWPWQPGTLRAFVSVLLVPIVLWLIFRVLERFI